MPSTHKNREIILTHLHGSPKVGRSPVQTERSNTSQCPRIDLCVWSGQTVVEYFGRHVSWGSFPPATTNIAVNATRKQTVAYVIQTYCLPAIVFLRYQLTSIPHSPQNLHQRPSRCCHASLHREVDLVAHGFR
jgi:hypothetical protein